MRAGDVMKIREAKILVSLPGSKPTVTKVTALPGRHFVAVLLAPGQNNGNNPVDVRQVFADWGFTKEAKPGEAKELFEARALVAQIQALFDTDKNGDELIVVIEAARDAELALAKIHAEAVEASGEAEQAKAGASNWGNPLVEEAQAPNAPQSALIETRGRIQAFAYKTKTNLGEPSVELAQLIAQVIHLEDHRRDGHTPYMVHVEAVVALLVNEDALTKQAAYLHDTIENHPDRLTLEELKYYNFDPKVIEAVRLLTHNKEDAYANYIGEIAHSENPIAVPVKLADIKANQAANPTDRQIEKYNLAIKILKKDATENVS